MTSALSIRPAVFASFGLATALIFTPCASRAESPAAPLDTLSHEARDSAGRNGVHPGGLATTGFDYTARSDATTAGDTALVENAWDFTKPDSIPGFASTPYPVLSNPEILD